MDRDQASVLDALIFARRILEFTTGMDEVMFTEDLKTQAAVLYEISVLGESIRRISLSFQMRYTEIPYQKIVAMRNKLVHDYDGINIPLVWSVVTINIPELIAILESIVCLSEPKGSFKPDETS